MFPVELVVAAALRTGRATLQPNVALFRIPLKQSMLSYH